ncbi:MAG: hypothetical protein GF405_10530 [Candidatus Eisenbacteria bacterium]|nr:hypothetical protein [Candidatus Eisenbacteria bacterium]
MGGLSVSTDMSALMADKKKLIMLAGLGLALIVVVVMRFGLLDNLALTGASASEGKAAMSLLDEDPQHLATVASMARARAPREYTGEEYRDPMQPLVEANSRQPASSSESGSEPQETVTPDRLPRMSLYGIIWDPENPIAMIDGMDLRVGDRIKGARITRIEIDRVVLSYRSREYTLTVN